MITRRLLLSAALAAAAPRAFAKPPVRVAALSWSMAEQIIELGVAPVAMADPGGYATWVVHPAAPEGIVDLGRRQEPNLELLAEIAPDLILISDDQSRFAAALERIAPVLHRDSFSARHDNGDAARGILLELGRAFGRERVALDRLAAMDARMAARARDVAAAFNGAPPPVAVIRFADTSRVFLHARNSMPAAALRALGLRAPFDPPPSPWGISMRPLVSLGAAEGAVVLAIEPFSHAEAAFDAPLWQAMPFVKAGRFGSIPPVWTYGGALSVGYLGDAIADAMLEMAS